jgi:hypothetical protein
MHAKYSPKRTHLIIICAVFWLGIMLALTLSDYQTRVRTSGRLVAPIPSQTHVA